MEFLFEFILEFYLELMMFIVPERGETSKKYRRTVLIIALAVLLGVFALFIWGLVLICEYNNYFGFIPVTISIVISIAQIIAGFILCDKKSKR